jgi:excisionase family DNA binding protein
VSKDQAIFITVGEACARLGVGRTKLYALLSSGEIAARKMGRATRIEAASVDRWAASLPRATFARWKPDATKARP